MWLIEHDLLLAGTRKQREDVEKSGRHFVFCWMRFVDETQQFGSAADGLTGIRAAQVLFFFGGGEGWGLRQTNQIQDGDLHKLLSVGPEMVCTVFRRIKVPNGSIAHLARLERCDGRHRYKYLNGRPKSLHVRDNSELCGLQSYTIRRVLRTGRCAGV